MHGGLWSIEDLAPTPAYASRYLLWASDSIALKNHYGEASAQKNTTWLLQMRLIFNDEYELHELCYMND